MKNNTKSSLVVYMLVAIILRRKSRTFCLSQYLKKDTYITLTKKCIDWCNKNFIILKKLKKTPEDRRTYHILGSIRSIM